MFSLCPRSGLMLPAAALVRFGGVDDSTGGWQTSCALATFAVGMLALRWMLGLSGDAVTRGAISPCASRTTWAAIRRHLAATCGLLVAP